MVDKMEGDGGRGGSQSCDLLIRNAYIIALHLSILQLAVSDLSRIVPHPAFPVALRLQGHRAGSLFSSTLKLLPCPLPSESVHLVASYQRLALITSL